MLRSMFTRHSVPVNDRVVPHAYYTRIPQTEAQILHARMHACTHVRTHALTYACTHTRAHAEVLTCTMKATVHVVDIPNTLGVVPGDRSAGMHVGAMCGVPPLLPTASPSMQAGAVSQFESTAKCMHRHVCSACEHECPICKSFCPRARTTNCVE